VYIKRYTFVLYPETTMFQLFWVALIVPLVSGITVSIPLRVPQGAPAVGGNLFSLSIEQDGMKFINILSLAA
jgi:hypothetical protein